MWRTRPFERIETSKIEKKFLCRCFFLLALIKIETPFTFEKEIEMEILANHPALEMEALKAQGWTLCGKIEPPQVQHTLAKAPPLPNTDGWLLAGMAENLGEYRPLVWAIKVLGAGEPGRLQVKCHGDGVSLQANPAEILPLDTHLPFFHIGFTPSTEWDEAETVAPVCATLAQPARQGQGQNKTNPAPPKKKKAPTPADGAGEALRLGQRADNGTLCEADLEAFSRSDLLGILFALNSPAANKQTTLPKLKTDLLQTLRGGQRLAPLFTPPTTQLHYRVYHLPCASSLFATSADTCPVNKQISL